MFCGSGQMEGLGFNLCVAPAGSLSPSISEDLSVKVQERSWSFKLKKIFLW